MIGPYRKEFRILPRKTMRVTAGPPVDLDDLRGRPLDAATLHEATERVIADITSLLEGIRGETAPIQRFDLKAYREAQDRAAADPETPVVDGEGERGV